MRVLPAFSLAAAAAAAEYSDILALQMEIFGTTFHSSKWHATEVMWYDEQCAHLLKWYD